MTQFRERIFTAPVALRPVENQSLATVLPQVQRFYRDINLKGELDRVANRELQREHIFRSKETIVDTATIALDRCASGEKKNALILGSGTLTQIPDVFLLREFDEVTFVDIDTSSTIERLSKLKSGYQRKARIIQADMTSMIGTFSQAVQEALDTTTSFTDFVTALNPSLDKLPEEDPPTFGRFSFVSSHLIMSQLTALPFLYVQREIEKKFGIPQDTSDLRQAIRAIDRRTKAKHIESLAAQVEPQGIVHLADTSARVVTLKDRLPKRGVMVKKEDTESDCVKYFDPVRSPLQWQWDFTPNQYFEVLSYALQPKAA